MTARAAALQRLSDFLVRVPSYGFERSFDRPGHAEVSCLSKWIRYRVISEAECVLTVLDHHSFEVAEKFVQEILWRTYWKGWLELHPQVWSAYASSLPPLYEQSLTHEGFRAAVEGRTGLSFFDDWVRELRETGYLHNHARMWFASVWIFTLQLPWQLGAEFMYRYLLDGDPASNTLSWRWVGGLQTPGKIYIARPDNIEKYSDGRWRPRPSELNCNPRPLPMDDLGGSVPMEALAREAPCPGDCILLHDDDLSADLSPELAGSNLSFLLWNPPLALRSDSVFDHLTNIRRDAGFRTNAKSVESAESVVRQMDLSSATVVHIMKPHCGELLREILALATQLAAQNIEVVFHRREWDETYFPLAKAGFFPFWTAAKRRLQGVR